MKLPRPMRTLGLALGLVLCFASAAQAASTAKFVPRDYYNAGEDYDPSYVLVKGDGGRNRVTLESHDKGVAISDGSGIRAGKGCTRLARTRVVCKTGDGIRVNTGGDRDRFAGSVGASVKLGGGNDTATSSRGTLSGGSGKDVIKGSGDLLGNGGADRLTGSSGADSLGGGGGNDKLNGRAGNDSVDGDKGRDSVKGGDGDDAVSGEYAGNLFGLDDDNIDGGPGADTLDWELRDNAVTVDLAAGTAGAKGERDKLTSVEGARTGDGNDTLVGSAADETFHPGLGRDSVKAGAGDDRILDGDTEGEGKKTPDSYDLGPGAGDWISYLNSGAVTVDLSDPGPDGVKGALDKLAGAENVIGSLGGGDEGADTLVGDDNANILVGQGGDDTLRGGGGDDELYGEYAAQHHEEDEYQGADVLEGGPGEDLLQGGIDSDLLDGGLGDDRIMGDLYPPFEDDDQGENPDDGSIDIAVYSSRTGGVTATTSSGGGEPGETDVFEDVEGIQGGAGNDVLTGANGQANLLAGGPGDDTLDGLTGPDRLSGQAGADSLIADDGEADDVSCGTDTDSYRADDKDTLVGCENATD